MPTRLLVLIASFLYSVAHCVPTLTYEVLRTLPHEGPVFTQGLVVVGDELYESAGLYGKSLVRKLSAQTGQVSQSTSLEPKVFGEGLTHLNGLLYQVTWKEEKVFVYDTQSLKIIQTLRYPGEAWGLASHKGTLILSDGTSILRFLEPKSFEVKNKVQVTLEGDPLRELNELEDSPSGLWANVWHQNILVLIDLNSGNVKAVCDLEALVRSVKRPHSEAVLNGIAYNPKTGTYWITGKDWPTLFEIRMNLNSLSR